MQSASYNGHIIAASYLIHKGADVNLNNFKDKSTALHAAVLGLEKDLVRHLLNQEAKVNMTTVDGEIPLDWLGEDENTEECLSRLKQISNAIEIWRTINKIPNAGELPSYIQLAKYVRNQSNNKINNEFRIYVLQAELSIHMVFSARKNLIAQISMEHC